MIGRIFRTISQLPFAGTTERLLTSVAVASALGALLAAAAALGHVPVPAAIVAAVAAAPLVGCAVGATVLAVTSLQLRRLRVGGPYREALGPLAAFATARSLTSGEPVELALHSTAPVSARWVRLGAEREIVAQDPVSVSATPQDNRFDRRRGYDWPVAATLPTDGLSPGLYAIELRQTEGAGARWAVPMLVKPKTTPAVAVIASTNTWEAYNTYGGLSNYENRHLSRWLHWVLRHTHALPRYYWPTLPDRRPNDIVSHELLTIERPDADHHSRLIGAEWPVLAYLERRGIDYGVYADSDLASDPAATSADLLILAGHAEYWTGEMAHALERYVAAGGHVLIAAGNPLFRRVDRIAGGLTVDPVPPSEAAVARLIGTFYTDSGRFTAAPLAVRAPGHWVFDGTGVGPDAVIGRRAGFRPWQADTRHQDGASGVFTQKVGFGSGGFEILATGLNEEGPAHVVFRETEAGGWVFNASSASFACCLGRDPVIDRMTDNLVDSALAAGRASGRGPARLAG